MTRLQPLLLTFVVVLFLAWNGVVPGQTAEPPASGDLRDSGAHPWVVIQASLQDFTGHSDRIVADFGTKEQARDCAARLNQTQKAGSNVLYGYRQRSPGPASVAGKSFRGKIGKCSVVIHLAEGGEFSVTGDVETQGKWTQAGTGLLLETESSRYRGNIEGDKITGVRFMKDGSEPITTWSVMLRDDPSSRLVGRWVEQTRETGSVNTVTLALRPDNTGAWLHDFDYVTANGGMVQSRLLQVEVRWRFEKEPDVDEPRDGILLEHVRGDQPWTAKWIELGAEGLAPPWRKTG